VSAPTRIWRWSRRNPKLVGAGVAGLLLGAATVWLFRAEIFRVPPFNPPEKSIAVLPFVNLSTTDAQQHLGDGISEEILSTLAKLNGLHVAGRTSSFSLKGKNTKEIAEKLNVGNVLEGSLQREGNRVRVTAELIDARNGFRTWTETYDRELDGTFALQDGIARSIVDALKSKLGVQISAHEQIARVSPQEKSRAGVDNVYLQRLFADVTQANGIHNPSISVPPQNSSTPFTVPEYTSSQVLNPPHTDIHVTAAPRETEAVTSVHSHTSQPGLRVNKTTPHGTAAPPETALASSVRRRESETDARTNKMTAEGAASIQGFVKDAKGEPIKGAGIQVESRDGKQVFSTVRTDPNGRYASQALQPGVYRVKLLVNGAVKASIMNTQTKANQPTQLNFDFKATSQRTAVAKSGKRMVWVPNRTGSHIGGNWVEIDDEGNPHFDSNSQTYSVRR
jgi:TolB-like protein